MLISVSLLLFYLSKKIYEKIFSFLYTNFLTIQSNFYFCKIFCKEKPFFFKLSYYNEIKSIKLIFTLKKIIFTHTFWLTMKFFSMNQKKITKKQIQITNSQ